MGKGKQDIYNLHDGLLRSEEVNIVSGILELERKGLSRGPYLLQLHVGGERFELSFQVE